MLPSLASNQVIAASSPRTATSGYFDSFPSSLVSRVTETFCVAWPEGIASHARQEQLAGTCCLPDGIPDDPRDALSSTSRFTFQVVRCATPRRRGAPIGSPASFQRAAHTLRHRRRPRDGSRRPRSIHDRRREQGCGLRRAGCSSRCSRLPAVQRPTRAVSVPSAALSCHPGNSPAGEGRDARFA